MRYYRCGSKSDYRLLVRNAEQVFDLTSVHGDLRSVTDLFNAANLTGSSIDAVGTHLTSKADQISVASLDSNVALPLVPDEVWAAGVTYEISEQARENESVLPQIYRKVYDNNRPEIFFKATPSRTVGPGEAIGVREDSNWNVPEPELGVVLYQGGTVGYTVGNDVSSREIEGANPLYLPQAKVYDKCCALGPCFVPVEAIPDPYNLEVSMEIERDGEIVWNEVTSTAEMVRTCEELVSFYRRSNVLPRLAVLLTGTSLVPGENTNLEPGDHVRIEIESIGVLENPVVSV